MKSEKTNVSAGQTPSANSLFEKLRRQHMLQSVAREQNVTFAAGDYVKFEIKNNATDESEWMWLRVDRCDDTKRLVFGWLDSEPVVFATDLKLGKHIAVSYDNIRDHKKANEL